MVTSAHHLRLNAGEEASGDETGSFVYIGNGTMLLRYRGVTILTDPTFIPKGAETWLGYGITTTRLTDPAMTLDELPPLDAVLLSHYHGDHFDQLVERQLDPRTPIITTPQSAKDLNERGFINTFPLKTWESATLEKGDAFIRITAMPGRHGPAVAHVALPDVMGSMIQFGASADPYTVYITGDTMIIDELAEIPKRYPVIDLAILHLGGTKVLGVTVTMNAEHGVEMLNIVHPRRAVPIHYNDYDVFTSPLEDFQKAVQEAGWQERVDYVSHGDRYQFPPRD